LEIGSELFAQNGEKLLPIIEKVTLHLFLSIPECPMAVAEKTAAGDQPPPPDVTVATSEWRVWQYCPHPGREHNRKMGVGKNSFGPVDAAPVAEFREFP
jgi:hypothetical protein